MPYSYLWKHSYLEAEDSLTCKNAFNSKFKDKQLNHHRWGTLRRGALNTEDMALGLISFPDPVMACPVTYESLNSELVLN